MLTLLNEKEHDHDFNLTEEGLALLEDTAIFSLSLEGVITSWNSGAYNLLGLEKESALGKPFSTFFTMEDVLVGKPELQLKVAGGPLGLFQENSWRIRNDGTRFYARTLLSPVKSESGDIRGFIYVIRDISITRKLTELEDAIRIRDEFLSLASHELRTPLTKILLQLQLMKRLHSEIPQKIVKSLTDCETSSRELASLMDNLVDVTRLRLGKLHIKRTKTNIVTLMKNVLEKLKDDIRISGNYVHFRFDKELVGYWDQNRVEQLFSNLLSNALKFGDGKPIDIHLVERDGEINFKIQDQGEGIPYHLQPKIFERFERAVDPRKISGLGLGLYICRQIVVAHEGTIALESAPGAGATFKVSLPLKKLSR